jgi:hypothetical protein
LLVAGCASQKSLYKGIEGTFVSKKDTTVKLVINNGNFYLTDSRRNDHLATLCCDTITFGNVHSDGNGILIFNSDPSLNPIFIDMDVVEHQNANQDSIIFHIKNPIEKEYRKYNDKGGDLIYTLLVQPSASSIDYFRENNQTFEDNVIRYFNPDRLSISSIKVTIVPKQSIPVKDISVREIHTLEYKAKNRESNNFEINIPQLSYGFIGYKRLRDDYAKIVNQNTIAWDGTEFVKAGN